MGSSTPRARRARPWRYALNPAAPTKAQVDRLGRRLRGDDATQEDLRQLDEFRRSFSDAYECVAQTLRDDLGLVPSGRLAKSTTSIIEKLRRESIRLTQMQDIAGCRVVTENLSAQEGVVQSLVARFPRHTIIDRRERPSHGYRAVHVVVAMHGKLVEVQVRTGLQHLWAELSEKLSDLIDPAIKYGGGDLQLRPPLDYLSAFVEFVELKERDLAAEPPRSLLAQLPELRDVARQLGSWDELTSVKRALEDGFRFTIQQIGTRR